MGDYTVYCLAGTRLVAAETIQADNDTVALTIAAKLRSGAGREIWQGDRYVGRIEIDPDEGAIQ